MATTIERPKNLARRLLMRKEQLQAYLKNKENTPKPADITFIKPFTIPTDGK